MEPTPSTRSERQRSDQELSPHVQPIDHDDAVAAVERRPIEKRAAQAHVLLATFESDRLNSVVGDPVREAVCVEVDRMSSERVDGQRGIRAKSQR